MRRPQENKTGLPVPASHVQEPVFEAAVLFEAGWQDLGDEVWVNIADRDVAIARAMQRDNIPPSTVESWLDAQLSNAERSARADVVVDNNMPDAMMAQLRRHWQRIGA